jgi:hypothetical protein
VVAVYLAEPDTWALAVGKTVRSRVSPGGSDLAAAEDAFIVAARARAATVIATAEQAGPVDPAQRIKLQIDEIVDGLIFLFEPRP